MYIELWKYSQWFPSNKVCSWGCSVWWDGRGWVIGATVFTSAWRVYMQACLWCLSFLCRSAERMVGVSPVPVFQVYVWWGRLLSFFIVPLLVSFGGGARLTPPPPLHPLSLQIEQPFWLFGRFSSCTIGDYMSGCSGILGDMVLIHSVQRLLVL